MKTFAIQVGAVLDWYGSGPISTVTGGIPNCPGRKRTRSLSCGHSGLCGTSRPASATFWDGRWVSSAARRGPTMTRRQGVKIVHAFKNGQAVHDVGQAPAWGPPKGVERHSSHQSLSCYSKYSSKKRMPATSIPVSPVFSTCLATVQRSS